MKIEVFASVRNSHRTSQLSAEKHSFLSKCRFRISHERFLVNTTISFLFTSCKHRPYYYIGIIQIFE